MTGYETTNAGWRFKDWRPEMFALTGRTHLVIPDISFGDALFRGFAHARLQMVLMDNLTGRDWLDSKATRPITTTTRPSSSIELKTFARQRQKILPAGKFQLDFEVQTVGKSVRRPAARLAQW